MNARHSGVRIVAGLLGAILLLPCVTFLVMVLAHQASEAQAPALLPETPRPPGQGVKLDPSTSGPLFRDVVETTMVPVHNTATGETTWRPRQHTRRIPVTKTQSLVARSPRPHGVEVLKLASDVRGMKPDADGRDAKLEALRAALTREFEQMHEAEGKLIEQMEARLEALKSRHQQREDQRDRIVERRAGELTGELDSLDWHAQGATGPALQPMPPVDANGTSYVAPQMAPPTILWPSEPKRPSEYRPVDPLETPALPAPQSAPRPVRPPTGSADPFGANPFGNRATPPSVPSRRVELSTVGPSNPFDLARRISTAVADLEQAQREVELFRKLVERGAAPRSELHSKQTLAQKLERDIKFSHAQFNALKHQLQRDSEAATDRLERIMKKRFQLEQDRGGKAALSAVDDERDEAAAARTSAIAKLTEFHEAERILNEFEQAATDDSSAEENQSDASGGDAHADSEESSPE